jgi:hypothetical protein
VLTSCCERVLVGVVVAVRQMGMGREAGESVYGWVRLPRLVRLVRLVPLASVSRPGRKADRAVRVRREAVLGARRRPCAGGAG